MVKITYENEIINLGKTEIEILKLWSNELTNSHPIILKEIEVRSYFEVEKDRKSPMYKELDRLRDKGLLNKNPTDTIRFPNWNYDLTPKGKVILTELLNRE